jgi:hypothetical protein
MAQATAAFSAAPSPRGERVSLSRLLWVAPLTVAVALAVNYALKTVLLAFVPALSRMGQLREPMIVLTLEGAILAVVVFAAMALALRRPIFWYRRVALAALAVSVLPDLGLLMGGAYALMGMRAVGPLLSLMSLVAAPSGPPPGAGGGGPRPSGPPAGGFPGLALEQVLVLMLLHVAAAAVCILMLTTLTRQPESSEA